MILGCHTKSSKKLTIAAAANMQYVLKELVLEFNKENTLVIEIVLGSSGKLTAQIEAGAPFDIFLSANTKYPEYLVSKIPSLPTPKTYGYGKLAVFSNNFILDSLALNSNKINKIALPNPKIAPYGEMAKEYLLNLGLYDQLKHKLVYGESVMQTNQFVVSEAADIGFTAVSTLKSENKLINKMHWKAINENLYTPIEQQFLILNDHPNNQLFAHFLLSKKGQQILKKYGYGTVE